MELASICSESFRPHAFPPDTAAAFLLLSSSAPRGVDEEADDVLVALLARGE
jgi:hypothetical protein